MSIEEKLIAIAENEPKVYASGQDAERLQLWNAITNHGKRANFAYAFQYADFSDVEFIKPIVVGLNTTTATASYMFRYYRGKTLPKKIDLSNIPTSATHSELFFKSDLEEIEDIGIPALNAYHNTFYGCSKLKRIHAIRCLIDTTFFQTFNGCSSLEDVTFIGAIGEDISFKDSPLSLNTLLHIIDHLDNVHQPSTPILTIGSTNLAKLTNEQIAQATQKGWTVT